MLHGLSKPRLGHQPPLCCMKRRDSFRAMAVNPLRMARCLWKTARSPRLARKAAWMSRAALCASTLGVRPSYRRSSIRTVTLASSRASLTARIISRATRSGKIWVDDRNGRAPRLPPNLYRAAIDEGHRHGFRVNAHVFYHTDAVDLVNAGIDGFAHLVRDKEMDDELIASIVRHNVFIMPNLAPEWNTYAELPHWLKEGDPLMALLRESVSPPVIERIRKASENRDLAAVQRTRTQYAILQRSLAN